MNDNMPPVGYIDLLDSAIKTEEQSRDPSEYLPLRPSSAGECERALFYQYQEYKNGQYLYDKEDKDPATIRLLSLGHSIEYSLINNFKVMQREFGINIKYLQQAVTVFTLDDGTIIQGSTDLCLENDAFKAVCDVKSKKDAFNIAFKTRFDEELNKYSNFKSFKKLSNNCFYAEDVKALVEELGDDFKVNNILQLNAYTCSDFYQERGYDHACLFYYNKNDSRLMEIRFKPDKDLVKLVKDKFQKVYNANKVEDTEKTFRLGSIRCAFCDYKEVCWSNDDPLKAWFRTLPKKTFPTDIGRVKGKTKLKKLFKDYESFKSEENINKAIENEICDLLSEQRINKIRLDNGNIYEVKLLKSPREHLELRRSKI